MGAIASLGVAPEVRGRGVGTALLQHLHVASDVRGDALTMLYAFRQRFYARARLRHDELAPSARDRSVLRCRRRGVRSRVLGSVAPAATTRRRMRGAYARRAAASERMAHAQRRALGSPSRARATAVLRRGPPRARRRSEASRATSRSSSSSARRMPRRRSSSTSSRPTTTSRASRSSARSLRCAIRWWRSSSRSTTTIRSSSRSSTPTDGATARDASSTISARSSADRWCASRTSRAPSRRAGTPPTVRFDVVVHAGEGETNGAGEELAVSIRVTDGRARGLGGARRSGGTPDDARRRSRACSTAALRPSDAVRLGLADADARTLARADAIFAMPPVAPIDPF